MVNIRQDKEAKTWISFECMICVSDNLYNNNNLIWIEHTYFVTFCKSRFKCLQITILNSACNNESIITFDWYSVDSSDINKKLYWEFY